MSGSYMLCYASLRKVTLTNIRPEENINIYKAHSIKIYLKI